MFKVVATATCPWCEKAVSLLAQRNLKFTKEVLQGESLSEFKQLGFKTVPQIWHGAEYVGGYEELVRYLRIHDVS